MNSVENQAREANSAEKWDRLWKDEGLDSWRGVALEQVYGRIVQLMPRYSQVIDIGGGVGLLAKQLREQSNCDAEVWDISPEAVETARSLGIKAHAFDVEKDFYEIPKGTVVVSTECLEHLSEKARHELLTRAAKSGQAFISVPNDRLGPDEEPQHTVKFTALEYKRYLEQYFDDVRVEVMGPPAAPRNQPAFLLGICGFPKKTKLSVCFPARDEAADIEKTLASFRGVADEMVVGVDPRTVDKTWELAEKYAEKVFFLDSPQGEGAAKLSEKGVHFAHIRNQCIDKCDGPWIFMTEAHETLSAGVDSLLNLDQLPEAAKVVSVTRRGGPPAKRQRWAFPWLIKKDPKIRYIRATHNTVDWPDGTHIVAIPSIETLHERVHERDVARQAQRKVQNRLNLMHDWLENQNENSLFYLGSEWREYDSEKAISYLQDYITLNRSNGALRYHTRLIVGKMLAQAGRVEEAKDCLHAASRDDWSRIEHWVFLGDIAISQEKPEEALQYYLYASTRLGDPPFTTWWIDEAFYSYFVAQRLTMTFAELGQLQNALIWAKKVKDLLPSEAPAEMAAEADEIVTTLEEALDGKQA